MIAYLDLAGGLAGDIFIAACLQAGQEAGLTSAELTGHLIKLPLGPWKMEREVVPVHGLRAGRIRFLTEASPPHRHWAQIRDEIIGPTDLPPAAKAMALTAFEALAQAEALAHGVEVDQVHFHEVGADDSILDLVGGALALHLLGITELTASPVPLSRGVGSCDHGALPLPAPATVELLRGKPVFGTDSPTELVTPTGAAVLTWTAAHGPLPPMELVGVGAGVGHRLPAAGLTRLFIGRDRSGDRLPGDRVTVITTTIDDSNPELLGPVMDRLLVMGALDATFCPIQMKKNRPGVRLEVLAPPDLVDELGRYILEQTTTIGLRFREEGRVYLNRRPGRVETGFGPIEGKWIERPSGRWEFRPEFEAVRRLAEETDQPLTAMYTAAQAAALGRGPD